MGSGAARGSVEQCGASVGQCGAVGGSAGQCGAVRGSAGSAGQCKAVQGSVGSVGSVGQYGQCGAVDSPRPKVEGSVGLASSRATKPTILFPVLWFQSAHQGFPSSAADH